MAIVTKGSGGSIKFSGTGGRMIAGTAPFGGAGGGGAGGGGAGGGPGVAGLMNWLKADAGVVSMGGNITSWEDQSGNSRHWSAAGTAITLQSNVQNGKPVLNYADGAAAGSYFSTTPFLSDGQSAEIFIVLKVNKWNQFTSYGQFGTANGKFIKGIDVYETFGAAGEITCNFGNWANETDNPLDGTSFIIHNVSVQNGGNMIIRPTYRNPLDNTLYVLGAGGGPQLTNANLADWTDDSSTRWDGSSFKLFASYNGAWYGRIGEVMIYDHVLTGGDRTTVYNYLQGRWNI